MRPILEGAEVSGNVNMPYMADGFVDTDNAFTFADSAINAYVDNIKLLNFAPKSYNATKISAGGGIQSQLTIPAVAYNTSYS